ncbi:MAG: SoxR reducing system RseC family protein [Proteobacteria bacterium]|nr:SoxR reducing system RseC family protein [Pseudomonadota bacterium]
MIKLAKILQIDDAKIILKLEPDNQCSSCESHCSDGFLHFLFRMPNNNIIKVARSLGSDKCHFRDELNFFNQDHQVNDIVGLNFDENKLLKSALILYGLPITLIVLLLITGYFSFKYLAIGADMGGIFGLISGLLLAKYLIKKHYEKIQLEVKFFK